MGKEMSRTTKVGKRYNQETLRQECDITTVFAIISVVKGLKGRTFHHP